MLYPGRSTEDETLFFQEVTESWNEMNNVKTDPAAEVHGPMESIPHHFLERKSGKLTTGNLLVSKMQPIKKPTNSNIKVHDWVRMIEIPQIPQPFGLST